MGNNIEEIRKTFFSLKGTFSQQMFIFGMCSVYFVKIIIETLGISTLNYVVNLLCLFPVLVIIQKRCRDFNSKGTLFIVIYTLLVMCMSMDYFINEETVFFYKYIRYMEATMCAIIMSLFFIPSKKEKDETLRSPLLKYPLLYMVICWVLAIGATWAMNNYAGVELNLF